MTTFPNLSAEMSRYGIEVNDLAKPCGIANSTFYAKACGRTDFKLKEMLTIKHILSERSGKDLSLEYLFTREDLERKKCRCIRI